LVVEWIKAENLRLTTCCNDWTRGLQS